MPNALLGYSSAVGTYPHGIRLFGVSKQYALVAGFLEHKVRCLDVSDPENIQVLSTIALATPFYATIDPGGQYAYVCASYELPTPTFNTIDISNPNAISVAASVADSEFSGGQEIVVHNNYAYLAGSDSYKITVIDITNPLAPVKVTSIGGSGPPNYCKFVAHLEIDAARNILFASGSQDDHVSAFDISDPPNISLLSTISTNLNEPHELRVNGNYLYVANMYFEDHTKGALVVVDITDPANMSFVTQLQISDGDSNYFDWLHGLWLDGNYLYATASHPDDNHDLYSYDSAINIFDVSDPAAPALIYSYKDNVWLYGAHQVEVYNSKMYIVADGGQKVVVWQSPV